MITLYKEDQAIIQPQGRLDSHTANALQQALYGICPKSHTCWVVDLTHVEFINSAGLTALVKGLTLASENRCTFKLHNPRPSVKLVLEIARLDELFEVVEAIELEDELVPDGDGFAPDIDRDGAVLVIRAAA